MDIEINVADVVLCEFYFSDLQQSKKRPVLVLKDNLPHNDFVGIPIMVNSIITYTPSCTANPLNPPYQGDF